MLKYGLLMIISLAAMTSFSQTRKAKTVSTRKAVKITKAAKTEAPNTLNFDKAVKLNSSKKTTGSGTNSAQSIPFNKAAQSARAQKLKMAYNARSENMSQSAYMNAKVEDEKVVSGSIAISYSQSLIDHKDGSKAASSSLTGSIRTKINENWGVTTSFSANQDMRDSENIQNGFGDVGLSLGRKSTELADWVKGSPSFYTLLPVSEYTTRYQNLQTILGASYNFSLTEAVLAPGFGVTFGIGASRNFHKYETDVSGRILNQYSMRESLGASYSVKAWSFSAGLTFTHGWNYKGSTSQAFEHSEDVGYSFTPVWSVSMGHSNGGSWFRPNGQDSNLKLINEDESIVYVSTSLSF